jgi:hypothetical protein
MAYIVTTSAEANESEQNSAWEEEWRTDCEKRKEVYHPAPSAVEDPHPADSLNIFPQRHTGDMTYLSISTKSTIAISTVDDEPWTLVGSLWSISETMSGEVQTDL